MSLRDVHRSDAFLRVRSFADAARFHVWHSQLGVEDEVDRQAQTAFAAGRGFAVVGESGSGKSSTLAAAALAPEGFELEHLPLRLSIAGGAENVHDPRFLASRIVRTIEQLSDEAQGLADRAASTGTAHGEARTRRQQVGGRGTGLSRELRQRTEDVDFERTPEEILGVAAEALGLLREAGVRAVLLLEDADGLLRVPGKTDEERHELANAFFADGLYPLLNELDVPAAIAVQPDYLALDGFKRLRSLLDGAASVPVPSQLSADGVNRLIGDTLRASSVNDEVGDVFDEEAVAVLVHNRFSLGTIRAVIEVCADGVLKALEEGHAHVLESDIGYAISQR